MEELGEAGWAVRRGQDPFTTTEFAVEAEAGLEHAVEDGIEEHDEGEDEEEEDDEEEDDEEDIEFGKHKGGDERKLTESYLAGGACWEQVKVNSFGLDNAPPGQRSLHVAVIYQQSMYIFGGYDGCGRVNEFHRFDLVNMTWQSLDAIVEGAAPSPRDRHSGVVVGDFFLVFGGFDGLCRVNDLHAFDFEKMKWEIISRKPSEVCPSARHSHSAVAYGDSMYVFGGYDGAYKNDLYAYDVKALNGTHLGSWRRIEASGRYPKARYRASCVTHENKMILFGGHDGQQHLNCTHVFDFDTETWTRLYVQGPLPLPRDSHVALVYNDAMFIFGGSSGNAMNDFHLLTLKDEYTWSPVTTNGWFPCSRFCHVAVEYDNSMYIYGGYDGNQRLKDFHRFKFAPSVCTVERSTLVDDLAHYVQDNMLSDIVFVVGATFIPAHMVFIARCSTLLEDEDVESCPEDELGRAIVHLNGSVNVKAFEAFLGYLYTDKVQLSGLEMLALDIYSLAEKYRVGRLKRVCLNHVSSSLTVENAAKVYPAAVAYKIDELRTRAKKFILENFDTVSKTESFEEMGRSNVELVFEILRSRGEEDKLSDTDPEMGFVPPPAPPVPLPTEEVTQGRGRQWLPVVTKVREGGRRSVSVSKRSLHVVAVHGDALYLFGGYTGEKRVNDFFKFSFVDQIWSVVDVSSNSELPPSARDRHTAVVASNSFWVFGGYDGRTRTNELHQFNFAKRSWTQVPTGVDTPSARHSHCATAVGDSFYVFGGYDGSYKNDLYNFDVLSMAWTKVSTKGKTPSARYRSTLVSFQDSLYLFAGHDGYRHLNDVHVYNISTGHWSNLQTTGLLPNPRDSHCAVVYGNHMYVFGGSSGNANNDFFKLRLREGGAWQKVPTTGMVPSPRFCHAAAVHKRTMYVFGGYDGSQRLKDFIEWSFAEARISLIPRGTLVNDLFNLVGSEHYSDVTFIVEGKRIPAHKILCSRCQYFQSLFTSGMRESREREIVIQDIPYDVFRSLLLYLYTDRIEISLEQSMDLFFCADRFGVERLRAMCENKMLSSIDIENVSDYFAASEAHSAESLHERCLSFIVMNFDAVSKTASFENMIRHNVELCIKILRARQ